MTEPSTLQDATNADVENGLSISVNDLTTLELPSKDPDIQTILDLFEYMPPCVRKYRIPMTDADIYLCGHYDLNCSIPDPPRNGEIVHPPEVDFKTLQEIDEDTCLILISDCAFLQEVQSDVCFSLQPLDIISMLIAANQAFRIMTTIPPEYHGQKSIVEYIRTIDVSKQEYEQARSFLIPAQSYKEQPTTYVSATDEATHKKTDDKGNTVAPSLLMPLSSFSHIPHLYEEANENTRKLYNAARYSREQLLRIHDKCMYDIPPYLLRFLYRYANPATRIQKSIDHSVIVRLMMCQETTNDVSRNISTLVETIRNINSGISSQNKNQCA